MFIKTDFVNFWQINTPFAGDRGLVVDDFNLIGVGVNFNFIQFGLVLGVFGKKADHFVAVDGIFGIFGDNVTQCNGFILRRIISYAFGGGNGFVVIRNDF